MRVGNARDKCAKAIGEVFPRKQQLVIPGIVKRHTVLARFAKATKELVRGNMNRRARMHEFADRIFETALSHETHAFRNDHSTVERAGAEAVRADAFKSFGKHEPLRPLACVIALDGAHGIGEYHSLGRKR